MTAITRGWLCSNDFSDKSREGSDLSEEILTNAVCSRIYLYLLRRSLNITSVGLLVGSKVRKVVHTVSRRIKLSRAAMPFSKPLS